MHDYNDFVVLQPLKRKLSSCSCRISRNRPVENQLDLIGQQSPLYKTNHQVAESSR